MKRVKLYRIAVPGARETVRDGDYRVLVVYESGKVYTKDELAHFRMGSKVYVGDLPAEIAPAPTFEDIGAFCRAWLDFERGDIARALYDKRLTWHAVARLRNTVESSNMPNPPPEPAFRNVIKELKDWIRWVKKHQPPPPTVWHHGGMSYSLDGVTPRKVTHEQNNILTAFLDKDEALDTKDLSKCVANVTDVIKKLAELFPGAVIRPKSKGAGYHIRVRKLAIG